LHGLQSRKAVSIIKEHQVTVLIFTGRDFSLGVTERAKRELFLIHATQNTACAEREKTHAVRLYYACTSFLLV
jgi:ADP-heptose:LPS heptosyltransferase